MSSVIKPDPSRRIDLEGVGPVPRPVDIDETQTGFKALRTLRIYSFAPPAVVHGHAEEDEVFIVILTGQVHLKIRSDHWSQSGVQFSLAAPDAPESVACAAYLPPHAEYELTPHSAADVAYARARPSSTRSPAIFSTSPQRTEAGSQLLLDESRHAERLRIRVAKFEALERPAVVHPCHDMPPDGEALVQVRTSSAQAATVESQAQHAQLSSWDTLVVQPGEQPVIRLSPCSSLLSLIVAAV